MKKETYLEINKECWNKKTDVHLNSSFYDVEGFVKGKSSLNEIELNLLGDIKGKSILHLQCHFGQDSLSLARMGAEVTGVDLSNKAIEAARKLSNNIGVEAKFIECDVYSLPGHLTDQFDIVFTSYGTIGWLPDMDRWAKVVSSFLMQGGQFVFADFHPVVWMFDDEFKEIAYSYFNRETIIDEVSGSYTDRSAPITTNSVSWNHDISEVLTSLLSEGLILDQFLEFDYSPYNCFNNMEEFETGKYRIKGLKNRIPMVYALAMRKPS
jgi:2-polyprenyl-3-methyl-5-hydroxy-6-metoxy-1,4-benzoquinol methylase